MKLKVYLKGFGRIVLAGLGFSYDFFRYFLAKGWLQDQQDDLVRNYHLAKVYHGLEKNLSAAEREVGRGRDVAERVRLILRIPYKKKAWGFHDRMAYKVLRKYYEAENLDNAIENDLKRAASEWSMHELEAAVGAIEIEKVKDGFVRLADPKNFFNSRSSVRHFSEKRVSDELFKKAVELAMKTPSACNRQPWHIYRIKDKNNIGKVLALQNGNSGFSNHIHDLVVITADVSAFISGNERYEPWIDGGMFSMSFVYSLHALGIDSCCLNWSQMPRKDLRLRRLIPIKRSQTVIMMVAIGYAATGALVCVSPRRPASEIMTEIL